MNGKYRIEVYDIPAEFVDIVLDGECVSSWAVCEHFTKAIRQQQADIAALKELLAGEVEANEAFRKAGGALDGEDMPTFCSRIITEAEIGRKWLKDSSLAAWFPLTAERIGQDAQEIAKLRARLAAIEAAPAVITVTPGGWINLSSAIIPYGTELVARPAKDAP